MGTGSWRRMAAGVVLMGAYWGTQSVAAELEWTLKKSRDGIAAYTAQIESKDNLAFKGETLIPGITLDQVLAVMRDVPKMDQWLHGSYDLEIVAEEEGLSRIIHMKNHTPTFLVAERDLVLRQAITRTSPTTAEIVLTGLPDQIPARKSFVRIPFFDGRWQLEQTAQGVRTVYSGVIDPGGSVPASITNMMVVDTPFETLKKLTAVLTRG